MVIISKSTLNKFGENHPESKDALLNWFRITKNTDWKNYHELKKVLIQLMQLGMTDMYLISKEINID